MERKSKNQKGGQIRGRPHPKSEERDLAEETAHHMPEEATGSTAAAGIAPPGTTARAVMIATRTGRSGRRRLVAGGRGRVVFVRDANGELFADQRLMLRLVQIAGARIAADRLPTLDHAAGRVIELASDVHVE